MDFRPSVPSTGSSTSFWASSASMPRSENGSYASGGYDSFVAHEQPNHALAQLAFTPRHLSRRTPQGRVKTTPNKGVQYV
jgi:hypothetical protein